MWLAWQELARDGALEKLMRADARYEARFQRALGALKEPRTIAAGGALRLTQNPVVGASDWVP